MNDKNINAPAIMKNRRCVSALFCVLLAVTCPPSYSQQAQLKSVAYPIHYGDRQEIVEVITAFVSDEGKVAWNAPSGRLIVTTTESNHLQIAEILKIMDTPPKNVQIEVRINTFGKEHDSGVGIDPSGSIELSEDKIRHKFKFKGHARDRRSSRDSMTSQLLVVTSGREAALDVGTSVPFVDWLFMVGQNWGYVELEPQIEYRDVGARLWIQPTVVGHGPLITVKVIPELSYVVEGKRRTIRYIKATTTVTGRDGHPLTIGGSGQSSQFYDRFLAGLDSSGQSGSTQITLIPRILSTTGVPPRR
jgi:type II secretory pathway component GspD/PulD (secretin)